MVAVGESDVRVVFEPPSGNLSPCNEKYPAIIVTITKAERPTITGGFFIDVAAVLFACAGVGTRVGVDGGRVAEVAAS